MMDTAPSAGKSLMLNCQLVDDKKDFFGAVFSVQVPSTFSVDQLKKAVKAEKAQRLNHLDADELILWKLTDPLPPGYTKAEEIEFDRKIKAIEFPDPKSDDALQGDGTVQVLHPLRELSEYWEHLPERKYLHLIVQIPPRSVDDDTHASGGNKRKRDEVEQARAELDVLVGPAPSSLANPFRFQKAAGRLVQINRPFEYDTLPIALLQPEFGDFKDDCTQEPSASAIELLNDLTVAACEWYSDEDLRRDAIKSVFDLHEFFLFSDNLEGTSRRTDGHTRPVIIPAFIRECKNNEGCALFEVIAYYANYLRGKLKQNQKYNQHTRFPCILMTDVGKLSAYSSVQQLRDWLGPQIGFYGCVWTGKNILVQPLTPVYDLTAHWTDEEARMQMAATLSAVLKATTRLNEHYEKIKSTQIPNPIQNEYPFPTSFVDSTGNRTNFTYTGRVENKLVFYALSTSKGKLVVKFTRQYSEDAHRYLAGLGRAPTLQAINGIPGGWKMIVMERSGYTQLDSTLGLDDASMLIIKQRVKEVVEKLHAQDLVHGDIRQVNILVDKSTLSSREGVSIHLIDFDWAGKAGQAKYPLMINTKTIRRPRGVAGGGLITKSHDLGMIDLSILTD